MREARLKSHSVSGAYRVRGLDASSRAWPAGARPSKRSAVSSTVSPRRTAALS